MPLPRPIAGLLAARLVLPLLAAIPATTAPCAGLPTLPEALASDRDVWGEAAMAQPNGPSYAFMAPLLPPPRYVNADFRHYPIVLSAPRAASKARLISNGSGINLRGGARSWHDVGTPFTFRVGPDELVFGSIPERTGEPVLAEGWLPVFEVCYRHPSPVQSEGAVPLNQRRAGRDHEVYALEAFAATAPDLAAHGIVLVRFRLAAGPAGTVAVTIDDRAGVAFADGRIRNAQGELLARLSPQWKWERQRATAKLAAGQSLTLAIATRPLPAGQDIALDYEAQRTECIATWRRELAGLTQVETPEPVVNHAARHLLVQNLALLKGSRIHYSAGNQYDQLYEAEGSDAFLAFLAWGLGTDARPLLDPLLAFTRAGLEYHQTAFKVLDVCRYYWLTRDVAGVRSLQPRWQAEADRILLNRTGPHGLLPAERYAGDISTKVQTVNASAHAWRALRDLGAVLTAMGDTEAAARCTAAAAAFRPVVLAAIAANARRETDPPFIPVALHADEPVHSPIVRSRIGSYWNIVIGYTIGSGIFPPGSPEETWIPRYQQQHGGLFLGMLRSGGDEFTFWNTDQRVNPLYGTRHALDTLRRDDPDRALVSFYGMLAQGVTRNTFIGGEGGALQPLDSRGRLFYCPPNSAGNAHLLSILRNLLVQDWDLDDDGVPETLRLLHATPRAWLEDGKVVALERAPTAFGAISVRAESHLEAGHVDITGKGPERRPASLRLRARLPDGWHVTAVRPAGGGDALTVDGQGTVTLPSDPQPRTYRFQVARSQP